MGAPRARTPDWRDADAYAPLLQVGRSGFAWEWLRRDPLYREAADRAVKPDGPLPWWVMREADDGAAEWGLHAFEAPERDAVAARPVWRREIFPYVVEADAALQGGEADQFDLDRVRRFVTLVGDRAGPEHLLLSDGRCVIRVDIVSGTLGNGPVLLRYRLAGLSGVERPLLALRQLLALWRVARFSSALHSRERRAARWILLLRTHDALVAGASQRMIAGELLTRAAAERRWRVESPSLRLRAQRLAREARRMAAGGYRRLLVER